MKALQSIRKSIAMNKSLGALKSKGNVFEMSLDEYVELTKSKELAELIATIRQTESHDKRRQLKSQLPFRCPHYFRFADNHRAQSSIIPEEFTFQTCIDIDDASQVEPALTRAYILDREKGGRWENHLLHVERSASGKLHLDIRIPVGMTIREAQEAYCKDLGIDFDEDCCTPERMIYITDESSQLYTSKDWCAHLTDEEIAQRRKAYTDRGLTIDGRGEKSVSTASTASMVTASQSASVSSYPETYQNIPNLNGCHNITIVNIDICRIFGSKNIEHLSDRRCFPLLFRASICYYKFLHIDTAILLQSSSMFRASNIASYCGLSWIINKYVKLSCA